VSAYDREVFIMELPWPTRGCCPIKKIYQYVLTYLKKVRDVLRIVLQGECILLVTLTVFVNNCKGLELFNLTDDCIDSQDASV
jgi:hypothetical protein